MDYPAWDPALSYGLLMALFAVPHVFVSHFAIGGGLYLVWAERSARRTGNAPHLDFVRRMSRFFLLLTVVLGALTGVAIWFIIGLLNPAATEALIHNFVWAWAVEWTFFLVEILAAILYARGWDRLPPRVHMAVGWVYFVAAWLSLVVINGIVCFMLTPGRWVETGDFWDGFLNPTYLPSLAMRTGICVLLAGLFGLFLASRLPASPLRPRLLRTHALWGLAGLAAAVASFLAYRARIPAPFWDAFGDRLTIPATALDAFHVLTVVLAVGLVAAGLLLPKLAHRATALVLLAAGLGWFGAFEWFRESIRKPWAIADVMYANGVEVARLPGHVRDGSLASMPVRRPDDGEALWLRNCRACHTLDGYNPVRPALAGMDAKFIAGALAGLHTMRAKMPPFAGNAAEREALGAWLAARVDPRPLPESTGLAGVALGRRVYQARCGLCHVEGGWKDKRSSLAGFTAQELDEFLSEPLTEEMPVFTGGHAERQALIQYLLTWSPEAAQ